MIYLLPNFKSVESNIFTSEVQILSSPQSTANGNFIKSSVLESNLFMIAQDVQKKFKFLSLLFKFFSKLIFTNISIGFIIF